MKPASAAIGEIARFVGGGTPAKSNADFYSGDIPWVSPKDMKVWRVDSSEDMITQAAIDGSAAKLLPPETVLVVVRSGILKHTLPVGISARPLTINQDLKGLIPSDRVHPAYLARMVKAAEPTVLRWVRATTADNFPIEKLKELRIPLPSLPDQQRIAAILDHADTLRRLRRRSIATFESLQAALFNEMFASKFREEGPLISDVCDSIANWRPDADWGSEVFLYLDLGSIDQQAKRLCLPEPILRSEAPSRARQRVRKGDVLVSTVRPYLNGVAIVPEVPKDATASTGFTVLRPRINETTTNFLFSIVRSDKFINEMVRLSTGASYPAVSDKIVKAFRLPKSTRGEREEFDAKMVICNEQIRSREASLLWSEKLFGSLEHHAFRGEL